MKTFPEGFLWGATVSAHKVEGGNFDNDWWRWEQRPGHIADGSTSVRAADHFHCYEEDFALARKLGLNALLISLEWSRIQPVIDVFDEAAMQHYVNVVDCLRREGIEPVCVLHDTTRPVWFAEAGGWRGSGAVVYFEHYVDRVAEALGQKCRWWIPILEPEFRLAMSHIEGAWPGGRGRVGGALRNMAQAHARAYHALHGVRTDAQVGVSVRTGVMLPLDDQSPWDARAARRVRERRHHRFLEMLRVEHGSDSHYDFLGVSYYGRQSVRFSPFEIRRQFARPVDGAGRPVALDRTQADPRGLHEILEEMGRYNVPLIITGNGVAVRQDGERCAYLLEHLWVLQHAIEQGADVRGYFHDTLLDGFEWALGLQARHGLIHVDWETQARTPNGSAFLFQDICRTGEIRMGTLSRFCPGWQPPIPEDA
ncbi:MAG TPA: family 1 glycosylhydrolase [Candidatus Hydrogenedentes bacterium]|nr:family 1 glycosylhydrolase [Candidatus Hydrogenedentota bacterium]